MIKTDNKVIYYIIIVLLIIFSILTIYGAYLLIFNVSTVDNPDKSLVYEGKLYFYNNEELLGTYTCKSGNCEYPYDLENNILIYGNYTFIKDGDVYYLVDILSGNTITTLDDIKYYGENKSENYLIAQNNDKYGVFDLSVMKVVIPFEYDDIDLNNTNNFKVLKSDEYYIIDNLNETLSDNYDNIYMYDNSYIITLEDEYYKIYDYDGLEYLWSYDISNIYVTSKYYVILDDNDDLYVYENIEERYIMKENIDDEIVTIKDDKIYLDDILLEIN